MLVRVFDRRADASLLAGLKRLAGKSYDTVSIIRAAYALEDGAVVIERVALDGNTVPGTVPAEWERIMRIARLSFLGILLSLGACAGDGGNLGTGMLSDEHRPQSVLSKAFWSTSIDCVVIAPVRA